MIEHSKCLFSFDWSNLFLIELIFKLPIITLFAFPIRSSFILLKKFEVVLKPKRKMLLLPEMRVTRKIFIPAAPSLYFLINLTEFFK